MSDRPRPPSVERVLAAVRAASPLARDPDAVRAAARDLVDEERSRLAAGEARRPVAVLADEVLDRLEMWAAPERPAVINATGVIVHTNLGRAPWPTAAAAEVEAATGYLLLEIDRDSGRRGRRYRLAEEHLIALTGAEDALVTNNNAAALVLAVGLVRRGGVVVSRGELVEIGGGVRIPDIIRRAGARLIEVGTTNRTRASDFEAPLADGRAKAVLRVHPSNFTMAGFTETRAGRGRRDRARPRRHRDRRPWAPRAARAAAYGLAHEPLPAERLAAGSGHRHVQRRQAGRRSAGPGWS
jgi:L-seryl-tRNA(Ser) seleniumtransferase